MLNAIIRVLGLTAVAPWIDRLPLPVARAVRLAVLLVLGVVPIVLFVRGTINYVDALLWLQIETVTIWAWGTIRLFSGQNQEKRGFARTFFPLHYGGFTVLPLIITLPLFVPDLPPTTPGWTFLVVGVVSFLAYGWSIRGDILRGAPFIALDWAHAYARMVVSYAALFIGIPLVPHTSNGVPTDGDPSLALPLGVLVLSLKLLVELVLYAVREHRIGQDHTVRSGRRAP